ncbi:hypothetical protein OJF2_33930 [Aquisphaera giovannonii]|uniref:Uncharacterized protein n=1 Tax=Aquisphaera giovannonii TaxID=406548 RepID=A0A5B9W2P4_9BACT|nr:hypothetical protein [Aquisphaera giovannonii]QEH34848.1 hypothetical protein OJF2_33930 [Aquisphaera giovannonii]
MSSKILNFLASLATDPDLMSEYLEDPRRAMTRGGLDAKEIELMQGGDARAIAAAACAPGDDPPRAAAAAPAAEAVAPAEMPAGAPAPATMIVYGPVYYFSYPAAAQAPSAGIQPGASRAASLITPPMKTFTHHPVLEPFTPWVPVFLPITPFTPVERGGEAAPARPPRPPEPRTEGPTR